MRAYVATMMSLARTMIILYFQESPRLDVKRSLNAGLPLSSQAEPQSHQASTLESGIFSEIQDKGVLFEGIAAVTDRNVWVSAKVSGRQPTPRYQVLKGDVLLYCEGVQMSLLISLHTDGSMQQKLLETKCMLLEEIIMVDT